MKHLILTLDGLKCSGCVSKISKMLSDMPEIITFDVSLEDKTVSIQGKNIKGKQLKIAIEHLGYSVVSLKKIKL